MQYQNRRAALNDAFRQTFDGGHVMVTPGIAALQPTGGSRHATEQT